MSCILFTFVEAIGHNQRAAITHLEAGLKIIGAWLREGDNSDLDGTQRASRRFMIEHIVPMFVRLDVLSSSYITSRLVCSDLIANHCDGGIGTVLLPDKFISLKEADETLQRLLLLGMVRNSMI